MSPVPLWTVLKSREEFGGPDLPLLTVKSDSGVGVRDLAEGRQPSDDLVGYRRVVAGDLVVNKLWARFGAYGMAGIDGVISPAYWVLKVDHSRVAPRYLHHLLRSSQYRAEIARVSKDMPPNGFDLPWSQFRQIVVDLPPLDEQRRIADFLDTETARLDLLLDNRAGQLGLLAERRTALVIGLVGAAGRGVRGSSGLEWLPSVPAYWPVVKLTLVARLGSGHTPSRSRPEWWTDPTIPWITTGEVARLRDDRVEMITETRESISRLGLANSSAEVHPEGTVVLSRTASVGYSAVMGTSMATSQDFATWTCGPRLDPFYLLWVLRGMRPWLLGARAMGSTHMTIYMPDIQSFRIPLPPVDEQFAIVGSVRRALSQLDAIHDALVAQRSLLAERRQALITAAVTGRLDVTTARGVGSR